MCVGLTLWSTLCSVLQVLGIQPVATGHAQLTNRNETSTLADRFLMKKTTLSRNDWEVTALHDSRGMASTVEGLMDIIMAVGIPPFLANDVFR